MKRYLFFSFLFFLASLFSGFAQQAFQLRGTVTRDQLPLPEVSVQVEGTDQGTYTNWEGEYQLELPSGEYTITFTYGNQVTHHIKLSADQSLDVDLTDSRQKLAEILIAAYRVGADSPITYSNLSKEEIQQRNLGQDVPILMNFLPNVVTTSDAGAGIGYTGLRVRGSDPTRVNVSINGVPLNDAESQGTFWVNLGDFTSAIEDLQLQRGVGTSTNGAGAFGGSLNVLTQSSLDSSGVQIANSIGSFNTHKHQIGFQTGRLNDYFSFSGNFSMLKSDGYRDRAFSDMKSYFLQGMYQKDNTSIKVLGFGGKQQTYQAYYGVSEAQMKSNRRYNPAGFYIDSEGNENFYDGQTDNYTQDHVHLSWNQKFDANWSSNLTLYYTKGKGYYESYKPDAQLSRFGMSPFEYEGNLIENSDLINQKWLDNYLIGGIFNLSRKSKGLKLDFGGGWNRYSGDHYGKVIYTQFAQNLDYHEHYYDNTGIKKDFNLYGKATLQLTDQWAGFADMQYRGIRYEAHGPYEGTELNYKDQFDFFNPKLGTTFRLNDKNRLYASYAVAQREPSRSDYKTAVLGVDEEEVNYPKAEQLYDWELGWRHQSHSFEWEANLYYMNYHNQLVLTGEIDPEGRFIRKNSGSSYRAGIEMNAAVQLSHKFATSANLSISKNQNKNFTTEVNNEVVDYGNTPIAFSPSLVGAHRLDFTPVDGLELSLLSKYVGEQYLSNTKESAGKLSGYFTSDFNISYQWKNAPLFKEIVFSGLVNNIFNAKYSSNGYYTPGEEALYYPQAGINFLTGINLKF